MTVTTLSSTKGHNGLMNTAVPKRRNTARLSRFSVSADEASHAIRTGKAVIPALHGLTRSTPTQPWWMSAVGSAGC